MGEYCYEGQDLSTIDADINAYKSAHSVPGLSLAIKLDNRLVFAKGYGLADQASNRAVTPNSMFRIMRISKSLTSTAIMGLVEEGHLKLTDRVFGPGSLTGDNYELARTSSWLGANSDPEGLLKTMTPGEAVSKTLATLPLAYTPNSGHTYSNFGFLILGRIVADIGGAADYETYVKKKVLAPSGVSKMILANDAGPLVNEVTYYPLGVTNGFRIHEFDSFGGWVGTPIELCRWSTRVDGISTKPDILSSNTEKIMWTTSLLDNGYGKGRIVNQPWRGHNGAFGGTGSFFTQRTDGSGIGFAVFMNINVVGDEYSWGLRDVVDKMISKVSAWPAYDLF